VKKLFVCFTALFVSRNTFHMTSLTQMDNNIARRVIMVNMRIC